MGWSKHRQSFPAAVVRAVKARGECELRLVADCTDTADICDHRLGTADALAAGWSRETINSFENAAAACRACHNVKTQAEAARGQRRFAAQRRRPVKQRPGLIG